MPSISPDYSDPDSNPLPVLTVLAAWFVFCWLVTSSFEHAILVYGGGLAIAWTLFFSYVFIDVTLHPYYGPHEDPAAKAARLRQRGRPPLR